MKHWVFFHTLFLSLAEALGEFLNDNCIGEWHCAPNLDGGYDFAIWADGFDVQLINGFLDKECIWHEEF